jgi:hypothetical protein
MNVLSQLRRTLSHWLLALAAVSRMEAAEGVRATVPSPAAGAPFAFTRLVAHWAEYGGADYVDFVADAQPELAQVGFYGAHFWSLAHTPQFSGYPAHFPVRGLAEQGAWFENLNKRLHKLDVKVVGHFNVEFLVGDPDGPEGPRGFFKFYRDLWDEALLGPKPVADPLELLEKNADGSPISQSGYGIGGMREYWACLRNPAWQTILKAWVRHGLRRGVDGFITNYFYRHNCLCRHCQAGFRRHLRQRFTPAELKSKFGIVDLERHVFTEIVSWHPAAETTPLRLEMLRFSQLSNQEVFHEVFVKYARSLKPDAIAAQWNHIGNFSQIDGDERCMLPDSAWHSGLSYVWYSTGDMANRSDLKAGQLGEATLQARYLRGAMAGGPFTLGKYEGTRIRAAIAELAANGGAPMGFYTKFTDPVARREIVRYYQFLRRHDSLYHKSRAYAEARLLFPRQAIQRGDVSGLQEFLRMGRTMLDAHVLFDIAPDDSPASLKRDGAPRIVLEVKGKGAEPLTKLSAKRSRFTAPPTVRVSASRPALDEHEIDLHFVNYDRAEPAPEANGKPAVGRGIEDEKPRPVDGVQADLALPAKTTVASVEFIAPELADPQPLIFTVERGRARFTLPQFLVYGVARVRLR